MASGRSNFQQVGRKHETNIFAQVHGRLNARVGMCCSTRNRTIARMLIGGGGGVYTFMFCTTNFFSNEVQINQFKFDLKSNLSDRT